MEEQIAVNIYSATVKCFYCKQMVDRDKAWVKMYRGSTAGHSFKRYYHPECYEKKPPSWMPVGNESR